MATEGTFILADIGGYTQLLSGVAVEHGKEITMQPVVPLISHGFIPILIRTMTGLVRNDLGRLKAFCEGEFAPGARSGA